jgi:anti-anti-sigma factor
MRFSSGEWAAPGHGTTTSPPLRTSTRVGPDGAATVEVFGELDIVTADRLAKVIESVIAVHGPNVTVDLAGVPFCDLLGLEGLMEAADKATAASGCLTLINRPSSLLRLFEVTGLAARFASRGMRTDLG